MRQTVCAGDAMTVHYLYRILLPDRRVYIGRSEEPKRRFSEHCVAPSGIGQAIRRYGRQNCVFQILCAGPEDYIRDLENRAILKFNTQYPAGCNWAPFDKSYEERKKQRTFSPGDRIPVNELPARLDAIFAPCTSPQTPPNRGWIEITANAEGRHAIERRMFSGWAFAWRQARFPCWRSSLLHLPSLVANCASSFPSELVRLVGLKQMDDAQLAPLLACAASDQGVRAAWFTFGDNGEPIIDFVESRPIADSRTLHAA
jgi:hypothetical protein